MTYLLCSKVFFHKVLRKNKIQQAEHTENKRLDVCMVLTKHP